MTTPYICPRCGYSLADPELAGVCPRCLGKGLLAPTDGPVFPEVPGYELLDELGTGGMAVVYLARRLQPEKLLAFKLIRPDVSISPRLLRRFEVEAEAAGLLDHPHVVRLYEASTHQGRPYLAMQLIEGESLAERFGRLHGGAAALPGKQQIAWVTRILTAVAQAVHYAHQQGVIHRDLKPANILLDTEDKPYVSDFGVAKLTTNPGDVTELNAVPGTPHYMAPEQARGQATTQADVYALGVILYEGITGRLPLTGPWPEIAERLQHEDGPASRSLNPGVDRDLESVCRKCLAKATADRYASAAELADDLGRWLKGEPVQARHAGPFRRFVGVVRRNPLPSTLAAATVLALVGLALTLNHLRRQAEDTAHRERVAAARNAAARGDWETALRLYDLAIADDYDDRLVLQVERLKGWFPLNRRDQLLRDLESLSARSDLGDHAPIVWLLQASLILNDLNRKEEGQQLVRAALEAGSLSAADQAVAHGLLAETPQAALECFQKAVKAEPFHHQARVGYLTGLVFLGRFDEARQQGELISLVSPQDPVSGLFAVWIEVLQGKTWAHVEQTFGAHETKLGPELTERLRPILPTAAEEFRQLNQPGKFSLPARLLSASWREETVVQDVFGQFALSVPVFRWQVAHFRELATDFRELHHIGITGAFDRVGPVADRLLRLSERHPDAITLLAAGAAHVLRAMSLRKNPEAAAPEAQKAADLLNRAADAPTFSVWIKSDALIGATLMEVAVLDLKPEQRTPERSRRIEKNALAIIEKGWLTPEQRRQIIPDCLWSIDPDSARAVLLAWRRADPEELLPLHVQAKVELHAGSFTAAYQLAERVLSRQPDNKDMQRVRADAQGGMRKLLDGPPKTRGEP